MMTFILTYLVIGLVLYAAGYNLDSKKNPQNYTSERLPVNIGVCVFFTVAWAIIMPVVLYALIQAKKSQ